MSDRIKVLHIIKSLGRGGAEILLPETLKLHDQAKFEFYYIYFLPWKDQMVEAIEQAGGTVVCLAAKNNISILLQYKRILQFIKQNSIDIVHCHLPWAGIVGRLIRKSGKVPVIYTEHNMQERYHWVTFWMNKFTFSKQDVVIAVSEDVAFSIHEHIAPRIKVKVVVNGVNTDRFVRNLSAGEEIREKLKIPKNAIVVGIVSVFRFQKRLSEWLQVFAKVSAQNPNVYGIIVGDGPLREEVEQQVRTSGLEQRISLPGLQEEILPWYSTMDIFMMSSVFEGLPLALLEAMSMGCAIVSTNAGGIKEVVRHEKDGLVVSVDQWQSLEMHLSKMCTNHEYHKQLGKAARKRVESEFSLRSMVDKLEGVYGSYRLPV